MKICFLHMTIGLADRGSEISTDLLASGLSAKHEVLVLQSGPVKSKPYQVRRVYPLSHAPIPAPSSLTEKLLFRLYLDKASRQVRAFTRKALPQLRRFKPDIIVAVNGAPQLKVLRRYISKTNPRPRIVVFGHAGIGFHDRDNLRAVPDLFVALTPTAASWAASQVSPTTRVVYIPNPLALAHAKPLDLHLPHPIILTVSALSAYKNVLSVVRALKNIPASYVLIGDGEKAGETAAELSTLPGDFRWIKHLEPADLPSYYASCDAFCFVPDPQEAFGRVYLEAMAAGLPIVASDDPIRRGIIGHQGIYVDPHEPDSITAGIKRGLSQKKVDYRAELSPYKLSTVVKQIESEFYALLA